MTVDFKQALDLSRTSSKRRQTKIVATLGPATSTDDGVEALIRAGVNVFRLNFSHATHAIHGENIARIRRVADGLGASVAVLADLSGPKIRVGAFAGGAVELSAGSRVTITTREVEGGPGLVPSQYEHLAKDVVAGDRILLDDGKLELRVVESDGASEVVCAVLVGGRLSDKKGMNLPGVKISAPSLTDKDKADALFAVAQEVDFVALSFVRTAADVLALRALLDGAGPGRVPIVAKIEKPEAIACLEAILDAADAVMVARGDLGVEIPAEEVPLLQSEITRLAAHKNRPVIIATQMLESMIEQPRPTRAEMTDVAWAALSRADCVMLSAETAVGSYPVAAVETMDRVLRLVEGYQWHRGENGRVTAVRHGAHADDAGEAVSRATSLLSTDLDVGAIVVPTRTGRTARLVSMERPAAPVIALSRDKALCRRLQLAWGLFPEAVTDEALRDPRGLSLEVARRLGLAEAGDAVLLVWDACANPEAGDTAELTVSVLRA